MTRRPLVSVVIPTHNRPQYLPRAVESAFLAAPDGEVEVIVVPNGSGESWKQSLAPFAKDARVQVSPVATAHANVARNHGMALATGKYIRFLDDDDYLLPGSAWQLEAIERANADICSGVMENVDETGAGLGSIAPPATRDFLCAAVSISGFTLPVGNLILREAIGDVLWDTNVSRAQDNAWMIDLAAAHAWQWTHVDTKVGVWFQHGQERTSSTRRLTGRETAIVRRLMDLPQQLEEQGRQSPERTSAIAQALWYYIHRGFPNHPQYWSRIAHAALALDATARPTHPLFLSGVMRHMNPLWAERCLLPVRVFSQLTKGGLEAAGYEQRRRRL